MPAIKHRDARNRCLAGVRSQTGLTLGVLFISLTMRATMPDWRDCSQEQIDNPDPILIGSSFVGLDVSSMTPEEQQSRNKIIQALATVQKAAQGLVRMFLRKTGVLPEPPLRDAVTTLDPLLSAQRDAEWDNW